jgi:hypothetical protein
MPIPLEEFSRFAQADPAARGGHALLVRSVLRLQQTLGNREVVRLIAHRSTPAASGTQALATLSLAPMVDEMPSVPPSPWRQRLARAWGRLLPHARSVPVPLSNTVPERAMEISDESARR